MVAQSQTFDLRAEELRRAEIEAAGAQYYWLGGAGLVGAGVVALYELIASPDWVVGGISLGLASAGAVVALFAAAVGCFGLGRTTARHGPTTLTLSDSGIGLGWPDGAERMIRWPSPTLDLAVRIPLPATLAWHSWPSATAAELEAAQLGLETAKGGSSGLDPPAIVEGAGGLFPRDHGCSTAAAFAVLRAALAHGLVVSPEPASGFWVWTIRPSHRPGGEDRTWAAAPT